MTETTITLTKEELDLVLHALTFTSVHTTGGTVKMMQYDTRNLIKKLEDTPNNFVPEWNRQKNNT